MSHFDREHFDNNGFAIVKDVLAQDDIATYKAALIKAIDRQDADWSDNPYYKDKGMVHNPMVYDDIFLKFLSNDKMLDCLESVLGESCILYAFTTSSMPPSDTNFSNRVHVDCPRLIESYPTNLGFFVPLDDLTLENGATYYLPGSHLSEDVPKADEFYKKAVRPLLKAGDGVIFNARTWHSGGKNHTQNYRHALTINVCRAFMKQRFDYPRLLGKKILDMKNERLIKFLGYRSRVPVGLGEYYVPPEDRLYYPNQG